MTPIRLIIRTLKYYFGTNLATAAGIAISTAVICGALIIGDSLKQSLLQIVDYRLGKTTHTITAGDRIFTRDFGQRLDGKISLRATPVLKTEAIVTLQGGNLSINKVQVWGVNRSFCNVLGADSSHFSISDGEAIISQNLAERLVLTTGDFFMLRIKRVGPIPSNTPFVSEDGQTISRKIKVKAIAQKENYGHLNMQTSQSAPFNIFVHIDWLNRVMDIYGMANMVMIRAEKNINVEEIMNLGRKACLPEDLNMKINYLEQSGDFILTSKRVFIDNYLSGEINRVFPGAEYALTYFVNSLRNGERKTPYSFVSALDKISNDLSANETIINEWLANDLRIAIGDSISMRYYLFGPLRKLIEKETYLRVTGIIPMKEAIKDQTLMPDLPGLSDAGNCRDWNSGIPINLKSIRQKDEDYWNEYKGTPKAYVSLAFGQKLWQNQFGNLTTVIIPGKRFNEKDIRKLLSKNIDPSRLEFQVNEVREQGIEAAKNGTDFSQLFAGLGIFIIISGLMLTVLMLNLNLKRRQGQIQLFHSLGFSKSLVRKIIITEVFGITLIGGIAGLILSVGYSRLILVGLNRIWHDIVRTDVLSLHYNWVTLTAGLLVGILLGFAVVIIGTNRTIFNDNVKPERPAKKHNHIWISYISAGFLLSFLLIVVFLLITSQYSNIFAWFSAGIFLFMAFLSGAYRFLYSTNKQPSGKITLRRLSWINLSRNPIRSFTIIVLLALGTFVIFVTAANRKDPVNSSADKSGGSGGFTFMAETTVPVLRNLNETDTRLAYGIPKEANFVQFFSAYDDDASCLNLNKVVNPRILAVDPHQLEGRFSFVSGHTWLDKNKPWLSLTSEHDGIVPAIADQTVIQWGLGKKTGDTLTYVNSRGDKVKLLLIGGLSNSVLQGNVIISAENFARHFSISGGSNFLLIDAPIESQNTLKEDLGLIFRDYGWEMFSTNEKLAEFNSIENTYLSIFFLMGAFGLLLGTFGLAIIIVKSMLERRSEMALLIALGFRNKTIANLFVKEYLVLFLAGTAAGTIPALIATLPTFISGNQNITSGFLFIVLGILILNGISWILMISTIMIKRLVLLEALRND